MKKMRGTSPDVDILYKSAEGQNRTADAGLFRAALYP